MITVEEILIDLKADLDAEGSDRYTFEQDYKPAINRSIIWCCNVLEAIFNSNKHVAEQLIDLKYTRVFKTSYFSRIGFSVDDLGHEVWSIISVMPDPVTFPVISAVVATNEVNSQYINTASFISSTKTAQRSTEEEYEGNESNEFFDGNNASSDDLKTYCWLEPSNYESEGYAPTIKKQIEIRPVIRGLVAVRYIAKPEEIEAEDDSIDFPASMRNIISDKCLNFIARKQGDGTTEYAVSTTDIQNMLSLFI